MLCNHCIVDKNWAKIHKTLFKPIIHKNVPKWRLGDSKAYSMGRTSPTTHLVNTHITRHGLVRGNEGPSSLRGSLAAMVLLLRL